MFFLSHRKKESKGTGKEFIERRNSNKQTENEWKIQNLNKLQINEL